MMFRSESRRAFIGLDRWAQFNCGRAIEAAVGRGAIGAWLRRRYQELMFYWTLTKPETGYSDRIVWEAADEIVQVGPAVSVRSCLPGTNSDQMYLLTPSS